MPGKAGLALGVCNVAVNLAQADNAAVDGLKGAVVGARTHHVADLIGLHPKPTLIIQGMCGMQPERVPHCCRFSRSAQLHHSSFLQL